MPNRTRQLDLLTDWEPPAPSIRFDDEKVRASSLAGRISRAVATALTECPSPRDQIAAAMSEFLGERVTLNMLNGYASQAREQHMISLPRFIALLHATHDRRLLELLAEPLDWAVIERKHLPLIELAQIQERQDELSKQAAVLRQKAKIKGGL